MRAGSVVYPVSYDSCVASLYAVAGGKRSRPVQSDSLSERAAVEPLPACPFRRDPCHPSSFEQFAAPAANDSSMSRLGWRHTTIMDTTNRSRTYLVCRAVVVDHKRQQTPASRIRTTLCRRGVPMVGWALADRLAGSRMPLLLSASIVVQVHLERQSADGDHHARHTLNNFQSLRRATSGCDCS